MPLPQFQDLDTCWPWPLSPGQCLLQAPGSLQPNCLGNNPGSALDHVDSDKLMAIIESAMATILHRTFKNFRCTQPWVENSKSVEWFSIRSVQLEILSQSSCKTLDQRSPVYPVSESRGGTGVWILWKVDSLEPKCLAIPWLFVSNDWQGPLKIIISF